MKSPNFSFKFVSHRFVQRLPLSGGLDQALISFWNPLNFYFKLKGERGPVRARQECVPSQCLSSVFRWGTGVRVMLMPSVAPATSSTITSLPSGGWREALVVLEVPAVGNPANALWVSSPCHNTPWDPAGSSQKSLGWAGLEVTAQLPLLYNEGGCFNAIKEEKQRKECSCGGSILS